MPRIYFLLMTIMQMGLITRKTHTHIIRLNKLTAVTKISSQKRRIVAKLIFHINKITIAITSRITLTACKPAITFETGCSEANPAKVMSAHDRR